MRLDGRMRWRLTKVWRRISFEDRMADVAHASRFTATAAGDGFRDATLAVNGAAVTAI